MCVAGGGISWCKGKGWVLCNCQISYREGLGMSLCIMGLTTQDPYIHKEHYEFYKIRFVFRVN